MVSGGACRIADDFKYSDVKESFMIRNRSGRYAGYADRQLQHLHHVVQAFSTRMDELPFLAEPFVGHANKLHPPVFPSYVQSPPSRDPASVDTSETPSS
ncbi:hypothetical protein WM40_07760 [Robbsia andropogonis]|uniref:Uncharacterized protein n=2 Tax=Robbsia andropogonis TaxID=28092 RepID=A0A0F5K355_9BURK|nr:hypothetical protein WM40_07760 [Robbsia andropogonis]